jgi:Family of unknown function (DUF6152)
MIMKKIALGTLALLLGALAQSVSAHHSFATFDQTKEMKLVGVIKEVQWTNPHIWVQLLVKDQAGRTVEWSLEGGSPNALSRQGWKRSSMHAGDAAEIVIHPLKDGTNGGSLMKVSINGQPIGNAR